MPKALILREFNDYGDLSALDLENIEMPVPGPGEVLIDVEAFALNYGDFELYTGNYKFRLDLPARVGDECAGRVLAVGPGVEGFVVGDRVSTMPAIYGKNGMMVRWQCMKRITAPTFRTISPVSKPAPSGSAISPPMPQ